MVSGFGLVMAVATAWLVIGVVLSVVMGRRGHSSFGWLVLGTLLGPLGLVLAMDARRHGEGLDPTPLPGEARAVPGAGPIDVLVGYDGSPEAAAVADAVADLLGNRLGRLTVATVVPYGGAKEQQHEAEVGLRGLTDRIATRGFDLEVLHGHPASALAAFAAEDGYSLIAVGGRGKGITRAILGSAASELARDSKVPVLLVGGR